MDSSDSFSDSCSDSVLSCSSSSLDSDAYIDATDKEVDEDIGSTIEPYQYEPAVEDNKEGESDEDSLSEEENDTYEGRLINRNW